MSKAPKQRKAQLHYQPYQPSGGANNALDGSGGGQISGLLTGGNSVGAGAQSQASGAPMDYGLSDLMDPVLTGYSSNLSRNLWDDWNENDPNLVKFDMFSDDGMGAAVAASTAAVSSIQSTTTTTTNNSANAGMGYMASMMAHHPSQHSAMQQQQHQLPSQHQQQQSGSGDPMDLDGSRAPTANGFHALSSQPRLSVKRSLSEDLVSMLDEDDGHDHDPFASANGGLNKPNLPRGLSFGQHYSPNSHASPLSHKAQQPAQAMQQPAVQRSHPQTPLSQQQQQQGGQNLLVQHATDWLNGFPAGGMPPLQQQQHHQQQQQLQQQHQQQHGQHSSTPQPPLSPASAARLEAHNQRPDPSPMARASAAIASTLVAIPNPCKESAPPATSTTSTPAAANTITPSPFSAYSFMSAAMESAKTSAAGEGSSEGEKANNPFANAGMMMPGFMMYSMPMMGNYQAAAAAAAAMGMMPMGAMQMGPMGMPMAGMQMNPMGMPMGAMGVPPLGGMQMGMPMMQMAAASMGMPMAAMSGASGLGVPVPVEASADTSVKMAPKALQPKGTVLAPTGAQGGVGGANNASFVSIARKPEEPEVSNILKSLMEEEAKKKEKKLERNRDSARESRKKQQTYVETLENGIKRLQINRDLVISYRWGVTGGPGGPNGSLEWKERVGIVSGRSESFSTLQNPGNFQNLMRINRQRRALSLSRDEKERAIYKCFLGVGKQLAALRLRLLELQVFRNLSNPASSASQDLAKVLHLSEEQRLQLECHSNRVFDQQVLAMVKLFKVFFALRAHAIELNLMSPELERYFRDVCAMDQLQKLLQWTELHRSSIEGDSPNANANALSLLS